MTCTGNTRSRTKAVLAKLATFLHSQADTSYHPMTTLQICASCAFDTENCRNPKQEGGDSPKGASLRRFCSSRSTHLTTMGESMVSQRCLLSRPASEAAASACVPMRTMPQPCTSAKGGVKLAQDFTGTAQQRLQGRWQAV